MVSSFAKGTEVPVARSRSEIESLLTKYGASSFASGWTGNDATIMFEVKGRRVRFDLPLPDESDKLFATVKRGGSRFTATPIQRVTARDAEHRRRWRALALVIKAKLEAVATGITSFEEEFLAHIVVPGGKTFGQWALPQIARAYETGVAMPPLLGSGS